MGLRLFFVRKDCFWIIWQLQIIPIYQVTLFSSKSRPGPNQLHWTGIWKKLNIGWKCTCSQQIYIYILFYCVVLFNTFLVLLQKDLLCIKLGTIWSHIPWTTYSTVRTVTLSYLFPKHYCCLEIIQNLST